MNLVDVMDEIGDVLDTIGGLNVYRYPVDQLTPPAAIVQMPAMDMDSAFQRGLDLWEGGITVAVSRVWDKAARDNIARFVDGGSSSSIHKALYDHTQPTNRWTSCAYARVARQEPSPGFVVGGVPFVAYQFNLDIAGSGT